MTFSDSLTNSILQEHKAFESELLKIQSVDCLPQIELKKVVGTFLDDNFQKKFIYGLTDSQSLESENSVCQKTSVFPLGKSEYCYENRIWKNENTVIIISMTTSLDSRSSAPVYFRTIATAFKQLSSGQIMMSTLTYGRGPDMPFHGMVKSVAKSQHQKYIDGLISTASSY